MIKGLKPSITEPEANQTAAREGSSGSQDASRQPRPRTASPTRSQPDRSSPLAVGHIQQRPIAQLIPYSHNARTRSHEQIQQIAASLREFGFVNPILIRTDNTIIAGHARLRAALLLGMCEVPVIVLAHLSTKQCRALALADNQLALNTGWDEPLLRSELAALQAEDVDLDLLAFDAQDLARLLAESDSGPELADPDAVPLLPRAPVTLPGDFWILGEHRLLCGDATRRETLDAVRLLGNSHCRANSA